MSQDSNNKDLEKNLEKNFKLMAMSAVVLLILFVYTIYKSSSHIQGSSYYIGIIFLFILLLLYKPKYIRPDIPLHTSYIRYRYLPISGGHSYTLLHSPLW